MLFIPSLVGGHGGGGGGAVDRVAVTLGDLQKLEAGMGRGLTIRGICLLLQMRNPRVVSCMTRGM